MGIPGSGRGSHLSIRVLPLRRPAQAGAGRYVRRDRPSVARYQMDDNDAAQKFWKRYLSLFRFYRNFGKQGPMVLVLARDSWRLEK